MDALTQATPEWRKCFELLLDPAVSEIEANGPDLFFMKKAGKRLPIEGISLRNDDEYYEGIEKSLVPWVKKFHDFDRNDYLFEGPLEFNVQGTRVKGRTHIVLPPATNTPQITIAKKSTSLVTLDAIAGRGSMSLEMKHFLEFAVKARLCIVLAGPTGAGKTTMLEALSKLIPHDLRIGVAEDTPELELLQKNVSYLHSVPWRPGMDPNRVATLDWSVAQFNRMRTDLLIIGETRGKEFAGFLTAANSGMEGCLTTIHANSAKRCLDKMSNFALKGSERQPMRAVNTDIANTVDLIVQLTILADGRHRVESITEVTATIGNTESADITTNQLYVYKPQEDKFLKQSFPTDALRAHFENHGANIKPFLQQAPGTLQVPHSELSDQRAVNQLGARPTSGLPVNGGLPRREV